ncbi:MAG: hypothetical protein CFE44_06265 [Burkholderiales bacterium PBB4]|nr:MAG: hypothetical protein CFE44_06265 [Burkholderiales bacterium PBB4]
MKLLILCLCALCLTPSALKAGDIYRWVDDQGRTQMSDVVPEKYRDKATRINSRRYELTPEQKADAGSRARYEAQRARDEKELERRAQAESENLELQRQYRAAQDRARSREKSYTNTDGGAESRNGACEEAWRRYNDGVACFSRFATTNVGGATVRIRPEAYQFCVDAPLPSPSCPLPAAR